MNNRECRDCGDIHGPGRCAVCGACDKVTDENCWNCGEA